MNHSDSYFSLAITHPAGTHDGVRGQSGLWETLSCKTAAHQYTENDLKAQISNQALGMH